MSDESGIVERVFAFHAGRDPERLRRKDELLRSDPLRFLRGTAFLFWDAWRGGLLDDAPAAWCCGDLHTENFGSYLGFNRLVYFDITDFDEACLAPASWDLERLLVSIRVSALAFGRGPEVGARWAEVCLANYVAALRAGRAMWVERAIASGPVGQLLRSAERRAPMDLVKARAHLGRKPRLRLIPGKTLPAEPGERAAVRGALEPWLVATLPAAQGEGTAEVLDVARRIAGNGSLGVPRFVALVRAQAPERYLLIDVKRAAASVAASHSPFAQPRWKHEAARIVSVQLMMQAASPACLGTVTIGRSAYVARELQPSEDRLDIETASRRAEKAEALFASLGHVLAWNQLRASGRSGAAVADDLIAWASRRGWQRRLIEYSTAMADAVAAAWRTYREFPGRLGDPAPRRIG